MDVRLVRSLIVVLGPACGRLRRAPGTPYSVEHWDRVSRASGEPRWLADTLSQRFVWSPFSQALLLRERILLLRILILLKLRSDFPPCDRDGTRRHWPRPNPLLSCRHPSVSGEIREFHRREQPVPPRRNSGSICRCDSWCSLGLALPEATLALLRLR